MDIASDYRSLVNYKSKLSLTKRQRDIIIGSLLGDECMRIISKGRDACFTVSHGESQKDYVFWKYGEFKKWVMTPPWRENRTYHKDKRRKLASWRFQTFSHPDFTEIYRNFYREGHKTLPNSLKNILVSPLSLAVWVMDDGNKNFNALFLNTQGFTQSQQKKLIKVLKENFNLEAKINKHSISKSKQLYRIRFTSESTKRLYRITKRFLLPMFRYKFPFYPRND